MRYSKAPENLREKFADCICHRKHDNGTSHSIENLEIEPQLDGNGKVHSYIVYCAEPTPEDIFSKCMYHFTD